MRSTCYHALLAFVNINLLFGHNIQSVDSKSHISIIQQFESEYYYTLYHYLGKYSCESCRLRSIASLALVKKKYFCCNAEIIQLIERDADTLFYNSIYSNSKLVKYRKYSEINGMSINDIQYKWVCTAKTGGIMGMGSLMSEDGMREMYDLLECICNNNRMRMNRTYLFSIDEDDAPLVMPVFPTRIQAGLLPIADGGRNTVALHNMEDGRKIYAKAINDSVMRRIANPDEKTYYKDMTRPRLRAIGLAEDSVLRIIGYVPLATVDNAGIVIISNRPYYCRIKYTADEVEISKLDGVCEYLYDYTYENALLFGDSVWATSPTWRIADTNYDSLNCLSVIDLNTCQRSEYGKIGEIYRRLNIGVNLCTGHVAVVDGEVYTTQTLTPWLIRERDGYQIKKIDSLFLIQEYDALETGIKLSINAKTTFQRADKYNPIIYTLAFFSVGNRYLVHIDYIPGKNQAACTIYNVITGEEKYYSNITHGGFIQETDNSFIVVARTDNGHDVYRYTIEE